MSRQCCLNPRRCSLPGLATWNVCRRVSESARNETTKVSASKASAAPDAPLGDQVAAQRGATKDSHLREHLAQAVGGLIALGRG